MNENIIEGIYSEIEERVTARIISQLGLSALKLDNHKTTWHRITTKHPRTSKQKYDIAVAKLKAREWPALVIYMGRKFGSKIGIRKGDRVDINVNDIGQIMIAKIDSRCQGNAVGSSSPAKCSPLKMQCGWKSVEKYLHVLPECRTIAKIIEADDGVVVFEYPVK